MDLIVYDTGSSFLVLETIDCASCPGAYDYTLSPDTYAEVSDTDMTQRYGDGTSIEGVQAIDWVCMSDDADTCVTDFRWMNIQSEGLGDSLNGILGMNADPDALEAYSDYPAADSYIDDLFEAGIIGERVFAFALRDKDDDLTSYLDVGFYDEAAMDNPDDLMYVDVALD